VAREKAMSDDLRERAEEIADFAVGEKHMADMYQRVTDMALLELRAAVEAEREACLLIAETNYARADIVKAIRARKP
jgi:hypothetical protein